MSLYVTSAIWCSITIISGLLWLFFISPEATKEVKSARLLKHLTRFSAYVFWIGALVLVWCFSSAYLCNYEKYDPIVASVQLFEYNIEEGSPAQIVVFKTNYDDGTSPQFTCLNLNTLYGRSFKMPVTAKVNIYSKGPYLGLVHEKGRITIEIDGEKRIVQ